MSKAEIVERVAENKRREAARLAELVPGVTVPVGNRYVNGHTAASDYPPFVVSQQRKEAALAKLREAQADLAVGETVPVEKMRNWMQHLLVPFLQSLRRIPSEMRVMLEGVSGPEIERLLDARIEGAIACCGDYVELCFTRAGKPMGDGLLDCAGGFRAEWRIIAPEPPKSA